MNGISFYKEEIRDCNAVYFTEEFFNVKNDGSIDVSNELQNAIKTVVDKAGNGEFSGSVPPLSQATHFSRRKPGILKGASHVREKRTHRLFRHQAL
mgnify:CR=1 FL=1